MKTFRKIKASVTAMMLFSATLLVGQTLEQIKQDPKYGDSPESREECAQNLSSMAEFCKQKVYEYAYTPWTEVYANCPASSKNIYIYGARILKYKIGVAESDEQKESFVDSLMNLYDNRIKYFGEESKVLAKKGVDLYSYRKDDAMEAYNITKRSIELSEDKVDESAANLFVSLSAAFYKNGEFEADQMINDYLFAMDALNRKLAVVRMKSKTEKAISRVEKAFAESGAADSDALVSIFAPKYEENKEDPELLNKIIKLLKNTEFGTETELYSNASESLFAIEPTADAASNLAVMFKSKGDTEKTLLYFNKAIELEEDPAEKAKFYLQLGSLAMEAKDYPLVRTHAKAALEVKPDYGEAYLLIGNAYAASRDNCKGNKIKGDVYWAAVDKFIKAKSVDPSVADKANELIARYKKYFPNNEDVFFIGLVDGNAYTVKCWINENTTVRTTKSN